MVLVGGCATQRRSYYPKDQSVLQPAEKDGAQMAVIEFDEHGDFWNPSQVRRADAMFNDTSHPVLVTYVHGWRHDAREDDGDLQAFRRFLDQLSAGLKPRRVFGVFVGWRGASVEEKGLSGILSQPAALLSFWSRKEITNQMAGVPFTNTLWKLAASTRKHQGHSILIGHSFGGRIVEHTLGPTAVAQMNNNKPMPYDLTFLINPASESLYARQLKLALRGWESNQPAIVALAAKDDFATGWAWPRALRWPDGIKDRDYELPMKAGTSKESQKSYVWTTVGNDPRQWTHEIKIDEIKIDDTKTTTTASGFTALNLKYDSKSPTEKGKSGSPFLVRLRGPELGKLAHCHIEALADVPAKHQIESKAYWVIPLDKRFLSGHGGVASENGIFSETMCNLMAGIIHQVGAVRGDAPTVKMLHPGDTQSSGAPAASDSLIRPPAL